MLKETDVLMALETLAAIPGFPKEAVARAAIGRALERTFTSGKALLAAVDHAVETQTWWKGIPSLIAAQDDEGAAFYARLAESDKHLALPAPAPEPLSAEEKAEIERIRLQVAESAKKFRMGQPGLKDRAASKKLLEGVL